MSEMKEILNRLIEMGQDIKDIKTEVTGLKTEVEGLKTRMGNLENSLEQIKTRQEVIIEQTAGLMEFRTETKANLDELQEDQLSITHIIGEHEVDIRGLRRRLA